MRASPALLCVLCACGGLSRPIEVEPPTAAGNVVHWGVTRVGSSDPTRTADFYAALLGGRVRPGPTARSATVDFGPDAPRPDFVTADRAGLEPLRIEVRDLDLALVELAARGLSFALGDAGGGAVVARLRDPDGRALELVGR